MNKYSYEGLKEVIFKVAYRFWCTMNLPYGVEDVSYGYRTIKNILIDANLEKEFHEYVQMQEEAGHSAYAKYIYAKYIEERNDNESKNENE